MKIAILEDDIFFQNKIVSLLNLTEDLVHVFTNVDSYGSSPTFYDLLLLDIHLGAIIEERKERRCHVHDIKNKLYYIKECAHKKDFTNMEDEVDKLWIECMKIYPSSICSNVYIDSFLSKFILNHPKLQYDIKINVPRT